MRLLVFDVGGTEVKYAVIDGGFSISGAGYFPTLQTKAEDWDNKLVLESQYKMFIDSIEKIYRPLEGKVEGIAMSLPGFVDMKKGIQCGGGALPYIIRRHIAEDVEERCGVPVRLANDGKCAALAEHNDGSLVGCENAAAFVIGTGVGGGLIIHGKLLNGRHFTAGEFSFLRINMEKPWDERWYTMGDICSTRGLLALYQKRKGLSPEEKIDGRTFFERHAEGEKEAVEALSEFCVNVAKAVYNLTFLLDLEKVAIGGGISRQPALIEGIRAAVDELIQNSGEVYDPNMAVPDVVACKYANQANLIGAYYLFNQNQ